MADTQAGYTVVGPRPGSGGTRTTGVILLNRSSRLLRRELIDALVQGGYQEIISVEPRSNSYTVEALAREFPRVRFILLDRPFSIGAHVNLAMAHAVSESMVVMWSTMDPPNGITRAQALLQNETLICVAPLIRGERGEVLPSVQVPAMHRRALRVLSLPPRGDRSDTLFPFDYVGLYHRNRFLHAREYDEEIVSPFWQKLDFGFRLYLWGERIVVYPPFRMTYRSMPEPEDQTGDSGYARFYAKNLAIRFREGRAGVPRRQIVPFAVRSGIGVLRARRIFGDARTWVESSAERYIHDPKTLVEEWSDHRE